MSYRQLLLAKKCHLATKDNQLIVKQEHTEHKIPLADLSIIVVDSCEITLTAYTISECSRFNVLILFTDNTFMPSTFTLPLNQHYRPYDVFLQQHKQSLQLENTLTEQLLKKKVQNQLRVLHYCAVSKDAQQLLSTYIDEIIDKDDINREGTAAKVFFTALYGDEFLRFSDDYMNHILNYGYGILRSALSRTLMSFGFTLYIGINHHGKTNPLNLVYDFIEPYRPIIDYYLYHHLHIIEPSLNLMRRKELIHLLNAPVHVNGRQYTLLYSMELLAKSYLSCLENGEIALALPDLAKLDFDKFYEPL